jgi:hypothetical protein
MQPCASTVTAGMQFLLSRSDATAARGVADESACNAGLLLARGLGPCDSIVAGVAFVFEWNRSAVPLLLLG